MRPFKHVVQGQRLLFGTGHSAQNLRDEIERIGACRVMLIAASSEKVIAQLVAADVEVALNYDDVAMHVPLGKAAKAREVAADAGVDLLVSVGGGSTTGLAKAIALTSGIPIIAVPTTYAGSEATNVWGLTEQNRKTTGSDDRVLPISVIYDAAHTVSLPVDMSVASGMNALAHCVDSMWAPRANPIITALATEGISALGKALPAIVSDPSAIEGREQALYGTYLSGVAFSSAGSGLHHKICHVLGGLYNLPHAETHAALLPYVLSFNASAVPDAERRIANALGVPTAVEGLLTLRRAISTPMALSDLGLERSSLTEAATAIMPAVPASNPRSITMTELTGLLEAAWAGADPLSVDMGEALGTS